MSDPRTPAQRIAAALEKLPPRARAVVEDVLAWTWVAEDE